MHPFKHAWGLPTLLTCSLLSLTSCDRGGDMETPETHYGSALESDRLLFEKIPDPGVRTRPEELAKLQPIVDGVLANGDRFFEQNPNTKKIELVERAFLATGRYIDLVTIYRAQSEKLGLAHPASERLAWSLLRLGQEEEATELIGRLLRANPKDPDPWFLFGAYWLKPASSEDSREASLKVILGWSRTIDLDPNYVGFEGLTANDVRQQLTIMNRRTKPTREELQKTEDALKLDEEVPPTPPKPIPTDLPVPTPPIQDPLVKAPPTAPVVNNTPPVPTPAPTPAPPTSNNNAIAIQLGRAHLAIADGNMASARRWLQRAQQTHYPKRSLNDFVKDTKTPAVVAWTLSKTTWEAGETTAGAGAIRAMATRTDLPATQTYQMAMFCWKQLEDRATAIALVKQLKAQHAAYATSINADALLQRIQE